VHKAAGRYPKTPFETGLLHTYSQIVIVAKKAGLRLPKVHGEKVVLIYYLLSMAIEASSASSVALSVPLNATAVEGEMM
jgi:hypothetical protein